MISVGTKSEEAAVKELESAKDYFVKKGLISDVSLEPKVRNMVVCVDFGKQVNLEDLALKEHVIYEPEQFPAAIIKISQPHKATALLFASGKAVLTGLSEIKQIEETVARIKEIVEKLGSSFYKINL